VAVLGERTHKLLVDLDDVERQTRQRVFL
jgi:hypothetical protein